MSRARIVTLKVLGWIALVVAGCAICWGAEKAGILTSPSWQQKMIMLDSATR